MQKRIVYDYAMKMVGLPYIWGGDDPIIGFDCSGLVIEILKSCGLVPRNLDANAKMLYQSYIPNTAPQNVAGFGSLAFYGVSPDKINHVAFCLDDFHCLEAGSGTAETVNAGIAAKMNAFVRVRPIRYRSDLLAILTPKYSWRD